MAYATQEPKTKVAAVAGVFPDLTTVQRAIQDLRESGMPAEEISTIVREPTRAPETTVIEEPSATVSGLTTGGVVGGVGGLLVGLTALALPGVGPFLVAGPLLGMLSGAAIGAATGGLLGALVDLGVPEEYAATYVTALEKGSVVVVARPGVLTRAQIQDVMLRDGAANLFPTYE